MLKLVYVLFQAAVKNLDAVEQNLEFARDLQKHLVQLVTEVCSNGVLYCTVLILSQLTVE